jgi:hypothetical protein
MISMLSFFSHLFSFSPFPLIHSSIYLRKEQMNWVEERERRRSERQEGRERE